MAPIWRSDDVEPVNLVSDPGFFFHMWRDQFMEKVKKEKYEYQVNFYVYKYCHLTKKRKKRKKEKKLVHFKDKQ